MYDFIADLDEYFCEKYANYDKLCVLPGYKMPLMQASEVREDGRTYAYTLPANTMRLALQSEKASLLVELKKKMTDTTFSFSFRPVSVWGRIKGVFSKYALHKHLKVMLGKYGVNDADVLETVDISEEIWKGIRNGKFLPSKNLIFTIGIVGHFSYEDVFALLALCEYTFDYAVVKDVVLSYIFEKKVFNPAMLEAALNEYNVSNLFLK